MNEVLENAAGLSKEEINWTLGRFERAAASFYPWQDNENYIDYIETIGIVRLRANNEILHRMEEGI